MHNKAHLSKQNSETESGNRSDDQWSRTKSKPTHVSHTTIATSVTLGAIGAVCFGLGTYVGLTVLIALGIILTIAGGLLYLLAAQNAEANELNSPIPFTGESTKRPPISLFPDLVLREDVQLIKEHVESITKAREASEEAAIADSSRNRKEDAAHVSPDNDLVLSDGRVLVSVTPEYLKDLGKSDDLTKLQVERIWDSFDRKWIMFNGTLRDAEFIWSERLFVTIDRALPENKEVTHWPTMIHVIFTDPIQIEAVHVLKKHTPMRVVCKILREKSGGRGVSFSDGEILN